jgi:hypothetical protein
MLTVVDSFVVSPPVASAFLLFLSSPLVSSDEVGGWPQPDIKITETKNAAVREILRCIIRTPYF